MIREDISPLDIIRLNKETIASLCVMLKIVTLFTNNILKFIEMYNKFAE